ncbi:MAG: hypothetical protein HOO67_01045 [Candidatus Peribacteraceae bacterium]|nr:hypothetical protein [Candidatus Peribacteraceae bacterium]
MNRHFIRLLLALTLLLNPVFTAGASFEGVSASVAVDDVVAGFETSVRVTGLTPGALFHLHVVSPSGEDTILPVQANAGGVGDAVIPARLTEEAGVYRAFAVAGQKKITDEASFEVLSDRIDTQRSTITVSNALLPADGRSISTVTVTLRDMMGNPLQGHPVQLVGSRSEDRVAALKNAKETDHDGRMQFGVQTETPGEISLRAIDLLSGTMIDRAARIAAQDDRVSMGGFPDDEEPATGSQLKGQLIEGASAAGPAYDVVDHFEVKVSTPTTKVRDVIPNFQITAVDANGKTVESYSGKVHIETPGDPTSTLPGLGPGAGEATMSPKTRGSLSIPWAVSFNKAGEQVIIVKDETGTITGQTTVLVTGTTEIAANRRIKLDNLKDGDTVGSRDLLISGKGPALANIRVWAEEGSVPLEDVTSKESDAEGETEDDGSFIVNVMLPAGDDVIVELQDQSGQYDSGPLRLHVDTRGPKMQVRFEPEEPSEGDDVTLTVVSEPGLSDVVIEIRDQEISLTDVGPDSSGDTQYQALFQAPSRGDAEYVVSARDAADNITDAKGTLVISGPSIPQVQNVVAQPLAGGIQLAWDEIPDDTITGYRIETKSPILDKTLTLDTPEATDGAAIMGLKAGNDYYITVRALREDEEGARSAMLTSRTLGMEVTVTPQEGGLLVQWTFPDSTPLSSFVLEYGSFEAEYSEERTLEGGMRVFTIKDLLAQPYLIRLTPVASTGEILSDLTVFTQGTPMLNVAFHASADDLQLDPSTIAPDNGLHASAPKTPGSGLPGLSWKLILALTAIPAGIYWYRRRKMMLQSKAFITQMERRYHS